MGKIGPLPVKMTDCGLLAALSVNWTDAVLDPEAVGAKVTRTEQFAPAARLKPQVLVWAKSPLLVPAIEMLPIDNCPVPLLVRVTDWAELVVPTICPEKISPVGESVTIGLRGTMPVPVSANVCGLPEALSVTDNVPVRAPTALGVNVTLMVQLVPAARLMPQVSVSAKSPVAVMLVMLADPLPVLVAVATWTALVIPTVSLPKASRVGDKLTRGALKGGVVPVPDKVTNSGLLAALSENWSEAERVPVAVGVKVTVIVQLDPAARFVSQLLIWAKSVLLVPITEMFVNVNVAEPVLVSVTVCPALVVPVFWLAYVREVGDKLTKGAGGGGGTVPVPDRVTCSGLSAALSVNTSEAELEAADVGV